MLADGRLTVCRGIFRGADGSGPFAADGDRLLWLVADARSRSSLPLVARAQSLAAEPDAPTETILGYAWGLDGAPEGAQKIVVTDVTNPSGEAGLGYGLRTPQSDTKTVTVVGAATHVLTFQVAGGGFLKSWTIDGTEILNRGSDWRRGMQWGMEWTDGAIGEFVRHNPVQGANIHGASGKWQGGVLLSFDSFAASEGGTKIVVKFTPTEADPGGALSIPLVRTWHGGGALKPVLWTGLVVTLTWWLNWRGNEGVHRVDVSVDGSGAATGFFDASAYIASFFDASLFSKLRVLDCTTGAETTLTAGLAAVPGYQVDWRRYVADLGNYRGDDEAGSAAMPLTTDFAGVAVTGAADGDLAAMWCNRFEPEDSAALMRTLGDDAAGNGWMWLQNRAGSGGPTGDNTLMLAPGHFLTNRLNPQGQTRLVPKQLRLQHFLITGTWAQCKARVGAIQR